MIAGIEQCDDMISTLQALASAGPAFTRAGTEAALNLVRTSVAAGNDPNTNAPFQATKKGTRPLKNAAGALSARIVGNVGLLILSGHHIHHFFGDGYLPKRRANLQGNLPERYGDAMRVGMLPVFEAITKKGKIGTKRFDAWAAKRGTK